MRPRTLEAVTTIQRAMSHEKKSTSVRSTVPTIVVQILGLSAKDRIRWVVDVPSGRVTVQKESTSS